MKQELKRVDPIRAANVGALVYGLFMGILALIFFPFLLLATAFAPSGGGQALGNAFGLIFMVLYPVIGFVMGWISGFLTSLIYNFVTRWTGGLLVEFESPAATTP